MKISFNFNIKHQFSKNFKMAFCEIIIRIITVGFFLFLLQLVITFEFAKRKWLKILGKL